MNNQFIDKTKNIQPTLIPTLMETCAGTAGHSRALWVGLMSLGIAGEFAKGNYTGKELVAKDVWDQCVGMRDLDKIIEMVRVWLDQVRYDKHPDYEDWTQGAVEAFQWVYFKMPEIAGFEEMTWDPAAENIVKEFLQ